MPELARRRQVILAGLTLLPAPASSWCYSFSRRGTSPPQLALLRDSEAARSPQGGCTRVPAFRAFRRPRSGKRRLGCRKFRSRLRQPLRRRHLLFVTSFERVWWFQSGDPLPEVRTRWARSRFVSVIRPYPATRPELVDCGRFLAFIGANGRYGPDREGGCGETRPKSSAVPMKT